MMVERDVANPEALGIETVAPAGERSTPAGGRSASVRCRPIRMDDRERVVDLLSVHFPARSAAYWRGALDRLQRHTEAQGFGHCGYVLQAGDAMVGVLLMIFCRSGALEGRVRCNLSSWCVDDRFRSFAPLLVATATRDRTVTFINISPERHTRPMVEAQGFVRYADGLVLAVPLLGRWGAGARLIDGDVVPPSASTGDRRLMRDHASYSCIRAWGVTSDLAFPLIFSAVRYVRGLIPAAHVIYTPDPDHLRRFAGPIGRFLAKRGIFILTVDAAAAMPGLPGIYLGDRMPKYFKGPDRPRFGDLAYTELPMFGA